MTASKKKVIAEGDNPYLVRLAGERRAHAEKQRAQDPLLLFPFMALIAVGEFIVGAISAANSAKQLQNISAKLGGNSDRT
jgi:hypothetical protein